jgi:16S rRNA (adenine1518-N6/adenine1519-N6)-dimethyltransferase
MNVFEKYNIKPKKRLGQNFLTDKSVVKKLLKTADLKPGDVVLEIGPGLGVLTKEIAEITKKVIAVEKDKKLCEILKQELKNYKNIEIINADALKDNYRLPTKNYKLIANLPFYIATPVIRKFLESNDPPEEMVLMVQKEVAQRITATPPKMSTLAVSVQIYAEPKIISYISKESFRPKPKVNSAIIKITPREKPKLPKDFFRIIKAGFRAPRKQLANNLSKELNIKKEETIRWLKENNIEPTRRAETLSIEEWIELTKNYKLFTTN